MWYYQIRNVGRSRLMFAKRSVTRDIAFRVQTNDARIQEQQSQCSEACGTPKSIENGLIVADGVEVR